ncbi:MAG: hypothetical protein R2991_02235 [Thermoanaerobaculia bacterium]
MIRSGLLPLVLLATTVVLPAAAEDFLPTPYTAEQIRDAWREGRRVTMRMETPSGTTVTRTTVVGWSAEAAEVAEETLDAAGDPVGEPEVTTSRWTELRDHARFPADRASRVRERRETPLGELEGWLYRVEGGDGGVSEFFFADAYPGPPVVFGHTENGASTFEAVQTENVPPASTR